jgi:hypothetical protein
VAQRVAGWAGRRAGSSSGPCRHQRVRASGAKHPARAWHVDPAHVHPPTCEQHWKVCWFVAWVKGGLGRVGGLSPRCKGRRILCEPPRFPLTCVCPINA